MARPLVPRKGVAPVEDPIRGQRRRGTLLGLAVGDALGATLEFRHSPAPGFPILADGPHREITGGGPFRVEPGQVTDDTQMACCLARSLRTSKGYDAEEAAREYLAWKPHAFDIGAQTSQALLLRGTPDGSTQAIWLRANRFPAGNGSLMRTAPIGVYFAADETARIQASLQDSALTHFDPRCQLACAALNGSIAAAIMGPKALKPQALVAAAKRGLSLGAAALGRTSPDEVISVTDAVAALKEDLALAAADDPHLYGPELHLHSHAGFVRVAFRLAYWELLHAPTFEAALIDVANRGGDADTNAAITGALFGAFAGEEALPAPWKETVLGALSWKASGPLWTLYHPRSLLET